MNITVPAHMTVIGSGKQSISNAAATKRPSAGAVSGKTYTFVWDKPSFPGTIVAGAFQEFKSDEAGLDLHLFPKPLHKDLAAAYAETAVKEFTYYVTLYGPAPSTTLRVVEIPDDTVPSAWAPENAANASRGLTQKGNYRPLRPPLAIAAISGAQTEGTVQNGAHSALPISPKQQTENSLIAYRSMPPPPPPLPGG